MLCMAYCDRIWFWMTLYGLAWQSIVSSCLYCLVLYLFQCVFFSHNFFIELILGPRTRKWKKSPFLLKHFERWHILWIHFFELINIFYNSNETASIDLTYKSFLLDHRETSFKWRKQFVSSTKRRRLSSWRILLWNALFDNALQSSQLLSRMDSTITVVLLKPQNFQKLYFKIQIEIRHVFRKFNDFSIFLSQIHHSL